MSARSKILNAKRASEIVVLDIPEEGEVKIEVRERNIAQQFDLLDKARKSDGTIDTRLSSVEGIIACCYDPDTGEAVFTSADRDYLLDPEEGMPASLFNVLATAVNKAAGFITEEEAVADLKEISPDATSTS